MSPAVWKAFIAEITKLAASYLAKRLGTSYTWLINLALKYGGQALLDLAEPILKKIKRYFPQKEALENLEQVDKKPDVSADELGKAYEETINAGKK